MAVRELARQYIIQDLIDVGCVSGQMSVSEFVRRVFPNANQMPTTDYRFGMKSAIDDIRQHMDNNDDWEYEFLFFDYLDLLNVEEHDFLLFLEQYVHPSIRRFRIDSDNYEKIPFDNSICVEVINNYLIGEGYELKQTEQIAGLPIYNVLSVTPGVSGNIKNIIFAAKYKPEIVFDDALNNDIRITKNENHCLIYDRPIPSGGIIWNDLVEWYAEENNIIDDQEIIFCKRLSECLDSEVEKTLMNGYYLMVKETKGELPALIPQVYLYYDPQTVSQRGYKLFEHQKMDFLMILSHRDRVVIEIDGKQHYADGDTASPKLYAEMVKAQREMSLYGYDVYRFGGYELYDKSKCTETYNMLKNFFIRLFQKYGLEWGR